MKLTEVTSVADLLSFAPEPGAQSASVLNSNHESVSSLSSTSWSCWCIVVSAGYAAWRGFMYETLTIFAWVAAAFATPLFRALAQSR